ncbi:PepSY domain-containing protein [Dehalobacterium formicoaceticum]|uniref:PepSY domain-containing protein n=1 Tax=Dehalobacterium formicoaceticum TaxID=51515 RepID=UPI0031F6B9FA
MDKKKIATLALVGVLALGGTGTAFAISANSASQNNPKAMTDEQAIETETQDENVVLPTGGIDQASAEQKALASIPGGVVVTSELEEENGVIVYGVEIKTGNAVHDVKVDAITGAILKSDQDGDNESNEQGEENDEQELNAANTKTSITEEQAKQVALASVKDGVLKELELEDEDGVVVYGVEIQSGSNIYDVKVDANSGSILKMDQDNEKDEKGNIEKESKGGDNDNVQHENVNEDSAGSEE